MIGKSKTEIKMKESRGPNGPQIPDSGLTSEAAAAEGRTEIRVSA